MSGRLSIGSRSTRPAILGGKPAFSEPVFVTRARAPDRSRFRALSERVFRSRWFTNDGDLVRELEARLRDCLGLGCCAAFANGTVALQAALRSLDLEGDVITTPFTFPATVHAIEWSGLRPVFCDIDPETYNLDPKRAEASITDRTCALLPVHVFGNPCDVFAIEALSGRRGLKVVYDAAHAFGVALHGRPIGAWGDLSVLSFHATKLFHTGEGGAVVGREPTDYERLALLRNFGIAGEEEVRGTGLNGKLSELQAALGLALLDGTADEIAERSVLAARYRERLDRIEGLHFQIPFADTTPNHAYFSVEVGSGFGLSRNGLHQALLAENIVTRKYFHPLCSDNPFYRVRSSGERQPLPNAQRLASRILCLPLYGELGADAVERVADCIEAVQRESPRIRSALA